MKRVVITGIGALTPIGNNPGDLWSNALAGKSGAQRITKFNTEHFKTRFACEIKDYDPTLYLDRNELKRADPFTQYALYAASQALEDSGLELDTIDPFDIGVIWGSGQGGMHTFEEEVKAYAIGEGTPRFNPFFVTKLITNMASGMISIKFGLMGINYTTVSACATSNSALMDALNYIRLGKAKIIVTGGSEAPITEASIGGFNSMKAMSTWNDRPELASRPFDKERNGFVMGEGAGALILEEYEHAKARNAKIYAEVAGAAMTADAYHISATHPEGIGAAKAMELALQDAQIAPEEVQYINAHATSTPVGDPSEIKAMRKVFDNVNLTKPISVSATKSMTGHLLGAAGAVEGILSTLAIYHNRIPATINTQEIDPEIEMGNHFKLITGDSLEREVNVAMSNTFGFGGHNSIVVFKKV